MGHSGVRRGGFAMYIRPACRREQASPSRPEAFSAVRKALRPPLIWAVRQQEVPL